MRLFESVKRAFGGDVEKKSASLTDPLALEIFGVAPTVAGPSINSATAVRVPAVYSAVVLISGAIGALPAKVFRTASTGGKTVAKDHPAYRLAHDEANDWTSAGELRTALTVDALLHGNGFAFANRVGERVVEFIRLDPRAVSIRYDEVTGEPVYVQHDQATKRERTYHYADILHIASPLGVSPIMIGREAIGVASILERHAAQLFASGARPSGIVSNEKPAGGEAGAKTVGNILKSWRAWQANTAGDPLILDSGWKYDQPTMTSTDAQFLESRRFQIEEIARLFRVPPPMLFDLQRATWSNSEEMFQQFLTMTLRPWLDAWRWAYARCLLSSNERRLGVYVEFVIDDLLTANAATRATVYGQYRAMGAMNANEVRDGLNLPHVTGGDTFTNPNITPGGIATVRNFAGKEAA